MAGKDSYGLAPSFERQVAVLSVTSERFVGLIGHAIDPNCLDNETAKLLIKVTKQIYKETGKGPSNESIVLQRLRRLNAEGKVSAKQYNSVLDLLIESDPVEASDVINELVPIVRRRLHSEVVKEAMEEYGKRGDFSAIQTKLAFASSVGEVDSSLGLRIGNDSFAEIDRVRRIHRMPTGVPELDAVLRGGPPRGTLTMFIAGSGGGKSMMLSHMAARNWAFGMFVAYATLELPDFEVAARVKANLTGVPTEQIAGGDFDEVREKLEELHPTLGTFIVQRFSPKHTTCSDIIRWVKKCEDLEGYAVDLVIVDYIDKLKGPKNSRENEYITQGQQAEELRVFCEENGKWGATASQAKTKGRDSRKRLTMDDVRDSSRKVDVSDLVIPISKDASGEMLEYSVDKFRYGAAGDVVGPLAHDWAHGRMVVCEDE